MEGQENNSATVDSPKTFWKLATHQAPIQIPTVQRAVEPLLYLPTIAPLSPIPWHVTPLHYQ
jgi:hypothetical protein